MTDPEPSPDPAGAHSDELPAELDMRGYVGPVTFPDIARRRIPGFMYLILASVCFGVWALRRGGDPVLVNEGFLAVAVALLLIGAYHLMTAWPLKVKETDALVAAVRQVGFPVGHASGQLGCQGVRSRPAWRILLYSADEPPTRRGVVLVDGVDGTVLGHVVEDNPETW